MTQTSLHAVHDQWFLVYFANRTVKQMGKNLVYSSFED